MGGVTALHPQTRVLALDQGLQRVRGWVTVAFSAAGTQLDPVPSRSTFWYAYLAGFPNVTVWALQVGANRATDYAMPISSIPR